MLRSRIIVCLLLHKGELFKTEGFESPKYVGDPINAVRIFNEKEADELMVLDIDATVNGQSPDLGLIAKLAAECRMPFCYGGGVKSADTAARLVDMGVEKVAVSSAAISRASLLTEMASVVGSQSVVAVLDIRRHRGLLSKRYEVCSHNGRKSYTDDPIVLVQQFQDAGAGEIVINSIDRDGKMQGFDLELAKIIRPAIKVPTTFLGGAGSIEHLAELVREFGLIGAAAGSLFVFKGKYRAVLINYPTPAQKNNLCQQ